MSKRSKQTIRAAIYVRVSSEQQADKISPHTQEADAREHCQQHGYTVAGVYRDTEKYRVSKRLVEPSGTRNDRPGLRRLIADADAKQIDVIIAWREDRLYRAMRPMLDVIDCIERNGIDIELVKETFDRKIAPVKAWAARMELDAKHDRFTMGVTGRLASGKAWNNQTPYGYARTDGIYHANEDEAPWVVRIWQWYADGLGLQAIRKQLISHGAPQRHSGLKKLWDITVISRILHSDRYWSGIQPMKWDGQTYEVPVPPIIDQRTAERVRKRREHNVKFHGRNIVHPYLLSGKAYCETCKQLVVMTTHKPERWHKHGERRCRCNLWVHQYHDGQNCFRSMSLDLLESRAWEKVWRFISDDELFLKMMQDKIAGLREQEATAEVEVERLTRRLDNVSIERQWVITKARKELLTDDDLDAQLRELSQTESELKRELQEKSLLIGDKAERLLGYANEYRAQLREGIDWLNEEPVTADEAQRQFEFKKHTIEMIVTRVDVQPDKAVRVHFELDLEPAEAAETRQVSIQSAPWPQQMRAR